MQRVYKRDGQKKAQAAMEYLMSYGWAIFVVIAVLASLWYFDVLNPSSVLPKQCQLSSEIRCEDIKLTSGKSIIRVQNVLGRDINIQHINLNSNLFQCTFGGGENCDDSDWTTVPKSSSVNFCAYCTDNAELRGSKARGTLNMTYQDVGSDLNHVVLGKISDTIE